jgi:hypothetical protein
MTRYPNEFSGGPSPAHRHCACTRGGAEADHLR